MGNALCLLTIDKFVENHRGKPKKGRGAREGKRIRHADQDFDYDDDTDL